MTASRGGTATRLRFRPAELEPFELVEPIDPFVIDHRRARAAAAHAVADSPTADVCAAKVRKRSRICGSSGRTRD